MNVSRKIKKTVSVFLVAVMIISVMPITVQTILADGGTTTTKLETIMYEDFEGSAQTGLVIVADSVVESIDGNKVLHIKDASTSTTSKSYFTLSGAQSGKLTFEYKIYIVSDAGASTAAFTLGSNSESGSYATSSTGEYLRVKTTGDTSRLFENRGGNSTTTPSVKNGAYVCGTWYNVKIDVDTVTKKYDLSVDDILLSQDRPMSGKIVSYLMDSVDNFAFLTGSADKTDFYIDNVKVSKTVIVENNGGGIVKSDKTPNELDCIDFLGDGWKIQLPFENPNKAGSVTEKTPQELEAGYADEFFFVGKDASGTEAVVLHCPVNGYTTANTTYARSELREQLDQSDNTVNWTWEGTHTLVAEEAVTHVPANGKVITSQIHGIEQNGDNANPLVKVEYCYDKLTGTGNVMVFLKNTTDPKSADFAYTYSKPVDLGEKYTTKIQMVDGVVYVTIGTVQDGVETFSHEFVKADSYWKDTFYYFKLGNYIQDSVDQSATAFADVWVYSSNITHSNEVVKTPISEIKITNVNVKIKPGERTALSVQVLPFNTYNKNVTWSVLEGADVVCVDKYGYITAIKEGTAKVEARSVENNAIVSAPCLITVEHVVENPAVELYSQDFGTDSNLDINTAFNNGGVVANATIVDGGDTKLVNENGNNVITLNDTSNIAASKFSIIFAHQLSTTTISFKIRIDSLGEHKAGATDAGCLYAYAGGSDSFTNSTTELMRIKNSAKGTLGNFSSLSYVITNAYTELPFNGDKIIGGYGDWVDVTYIVTPNDGSAKANTTDIYMNGYLVGSAVANRNVINYVNRLDFQSGTGDIIKYSVDEVKIYSGRVIPEDDSVELPKGIVITEVPSTMAVMDSAKAKVTMEPVGALNEVIYSVDGEAVVVSSDGYITAVKPGTVTLRVTSAKDNTLYVEKTIRVVSKVNFVAVESVKFDSTNVKINLDSKVQLNPVVAPSNAMEKGVKYEVLTGKDIISISASGEVTGTAVGTAKVRVTSLSNSDASIILNISVTKFVLAGTVIYSNDFKTDLDNNHWALSLAKDYTEVNVKDGAMTIIDANGANQPKATLTFDPTCGKVSMQFKIKVDDQVEIQGGTTNSEYKNLRIAFGTGTITTSSNEAFCIRSNGTNFTYNTTGSEYADITGDYNVADWNTVTLVSTINVEGEDTTDVYINGVKYLEGVKNKVDYAVIDKMCFSADTSKYAKYNIDDMLIWAGDYTDMPKAIVDGTANGGTIVDDTLGNVTTVVVPTGDTIKTVPYIILLSISLIVYGIVLKKKHSRKINDKSSSNS